ncbi:hypothetical protein ACJX0J_033404, partial [Zea mays]
MLTYRLQMLPVIVIYTSDLTLQEYPKNPNGAMEMCNTALIFVANNNVGRLFLILYKEICKSKNSMSRSMLKAKMTNILRGREYEYFSHVCAHTHVHIHISIHKLSLFLDIKFNHMDFLRALFWFESPLDLHLYMY